MSFLQKEFSKALSKPAGSLLGEDRMRAHLASKLGKRKQNSSWAVQVKATALMYSTVVLCSWGCMKAILLARGMLAKALWLFSSAMRPLGSTRADTVHFGLLLSLRHNAANGAVPPHSGCHSALRLCQLFWSSTINQCLLSISWHQILIVQCYLDTSERKVLYYKKVGKHTLGNDPVLLNSGLLRKLHMSVLLWANFNNYENKLE